VSIRQTAEYASLTLEETFRLLDSSAAGLKELLAASRISEYGCNEIAEQKQSAVKDFLSRFWSSMPGKELIVSIIGTLAVFSVMVTVGIPVAPVSPQYVIFSLVFTGFFAVVFVDPVKYRMTRGFGL